jgi:hypothetical protein
MRFSWIIGAGRSLTSSILVFVCVGICVYDAREYASAAPSEKTTTAHVVSVYHSIFRGLRANYYSCSYNFSVDGSLYIGLRDCPQWIIDDAVKEKYVDSGTVPTRTDTTVYYNPADPSVNSLLEFSAESQIVYRCAVPWIGLAALIILFFILGRLLDANEKRGRGGVFVDARGTVIYPEEIGFNTDFSGLPSGSRNARKSYSAANGEAAKATDFASSLGLRELYLDVVKQVHPDHAKNEADRALRERLTKEANAAFKRGDDETLRRILEEYRSTDSSAACRNNICSDLPNL